jgi:hypothetical protein
MQQKFLVVSRLPHAGLGNMLLVWARAVVFANINDLPIQQPNWYTFHIGPWLRNEKCKRYYGSFFTPQGYQSALYSQITRLGQAISLHANLPLGELDLSDPAYATPGRHVFVFDKMSPWNDYFQDLKEHQSLVKQKLYDYIKPTLLKTILAQPAPEIGIHIRRGDYQKPNDDENFAVRRYVYTALEWYIETLNRVRERAGWMVPATIFSDGYEAELTDILSLPNVSLSSETSAISDLLNMSRSKLLIASCHSSFSSWASYLGQCPTLWQAGRSDLYEPIFTFETRRQVYEGGFDPDQLLPDLLCENIRNLWPAQSPIQTPV